MNVPSGWRSPRHDEQAALVAGDRDDGGDVVAHAAPTAAVTWTPLAGRIVSASVPSSSVRTSSAHTPAALTTTLAATSISPSPLSTRGTDDPAGPVVVEADDPAAVGDGGTMRGGGARDGEHEPGVVDRGVVVDVAVGELVPRQRRHVGVRLVDVEALVQLADAPAAGEVVHPHRRAERPGDAAIDQPVAFEDRQEEREDLDEVRGVVAQPLALAERLVDEADVAGLEVADAAVDQLGALRRRPGGEVVGLDEGRAQASRGRVEGDSGAGDAAADDQHVEVLGGQPARPSPPDRTVARRAAATSRPHHRDDLPTGTGRRNCLWTGRIRWF